MNSPIELTPAERELAASINFDAASLRGYEDAKRNGKTASPDEIRDRAQRDRRGPPPTQRMLDLQAELFGGTPNAMRTLIRASAERWPPVIAAAKISFE